MKLLKKIVIGTLIGITAVSIGIGAYYTYTSLKQKKVEPELISAETKVETLQAEEPKPRSVANWNLQIFGVKKASDEELMKEYSNILTNYDIVFVQEIRDNSDVAFQKLKNNLPGYEGRISSKAGRSSSKEQYGVFYREGIKLIKFKDYNPACSNLWERPPIEVDFAINDYTLRVFNVHTKPEDVANELKNLEKIATNPGNNVILGDLNASGSYYNRKRCPTFVDWSWIIKDEEDTTVAKTTNAYDRVVMNNDAFREFLEYGINTNITKRLSDHYLIYLKIMPKEK